MFVSEQPGVAGIEIPFCQFCKHHHFQGVKCEICGHVGKSNLYQKMRMKASQLHSYHVDITDYQVNDPHSNELWDICYEIRKTIFCYELQYLENEEFDEIDQRSRHVVGFVGDLPVLASRWYLKSNPNEENIAIIDRCAVLPMYRNKKLASHTIELILKDIQEISQSYNLSIQTLQILVPSNSPLEDYLLRHGYQEIENTEIIIRGGITHRYLEQYRS